MSLRYAIIGPVAAGGVLAVLVAGWLAWGPLVAASRPDAAVRTDLRVADHVAALREAQHFATGLATALLAPPGGDARLRARLGETLAGTLWHFEAARELGEGRSYAPALTRLGAELAHWRVGVEPALRGDAQAAPAPDALRAQEKVVAQLADAVLVDLAATGPAEAAARRAAMAWQGALAILLLAAGSAGIALLASRYARAMARLPDELRAFSGGGTPDPLPGERRDDEFGAMARELRVFAESIQVLTESHAEMEKMALTDPLTGLPNRRGLLHYLTRLAAPGIGCDCSSVAALHIDIDHFKAINDTDGHEAGDFMLREATRRMASVIRDSDLLARLGGDEFVIFAQGITGHGALERLAERVTRQFDTPIAFRARTFDVSVSVGAALGGREGKPLDPQRLLISADIALRQAKTDGRNRYAIFTSTMAHGARREREQATEIRAAIARDAFRMWFRPVVDVRTGRPTALDLAPRWLHPEHGPLPPIDWIDTAEAYKLTAALALPAYEEALRRAAGWRAGGQDLLPLHLRMSRTLLLAPETVDRLSWMLDDNGIDPGRIAIETGEKYLSGRGSEAVFATLRRFADLGAAIVIDNFGSVDAALGNVTRLGARKIKVNVARTRGLLGDTDRSRRDSRERLEALLPGIVRIGESLGVRVLAKGVASSAGVERLRAHGFAEMQGDAIAPAMDAEALSDWLREIPGVSAPPRLVSG